MTLLVAGVIAVLVLWAGFSLWVWLSRHKRALRTVASDLPAILKLLRDLLRDPSLPRSARLVAMGAVAYIVSPIDLVPEFLPVGPLDDAIVGALALRYLLRKAGPQLTSLYWNGKPESLHLLLRFAGLSVD